MQPSDFQAQVIADSVSVYGIRITTFQLRYPRFIHSEFMTHRVLSRNARSSRAVPVKKLSEEDMYVPHFMKNQPGMQSFEELSEVQRVIAEMTWEQTARSCIVGSKQLAQNEVHKQWANRMLEWFGYIDVVATATDWDNFFYLRDHPMAMPEIQYLARAMRKAMNESTPTLLLKTQWHLPYIQPDERGIDTNEDLCLLSTARCARVSYKPFDSDNIDLVKDHALAKRLIVEDPLHASPAEHQARPDQITLDQWREPSRWGNFFGWVQHRKLYPNENYQTQDRSILACLQREMEYNGQA